MNILVIPTTDWIRHPFPNRLNFIFDILSERHSVHVAHFELPKFKNNVPRDTTCTLHKMGGIKFNDLSVYYSINSLTHAFKIREIIKKEKIDVILSANIMPGFTATFVNSGIPIVFDYLDHFEESASIYYPGSLFGKVVKKIVKSIISRNLHAATKIITVTQELGEFLEYRGVNINNINIIPNGVDVNLLKPMDSNVSKKKLGLDGAVIGYVGSLEYWIDLESIIRVLPKFDDLKLLIVGPTLYTDYDIMLMKLVKNLNLSDRVIFTGAIDYQHLSDYISAMDIGLNPLRRMKKNDYAAGGKIFNYLSCGVPVLSSQRGALQNLLGMDNGVYYYDDEEGLIKSIHQLLKNKVDSEKCRNVAEEYDWNKIAKQYKTVLESVIK
jgi:glycosyltransferase involved in cell wall biosynthesis